MPCLVSRRLESKTEGLNEVVAFMVNGSILIIFTANGNTFDPFTANGNFFPLQLTEIFIINYYRSTLQVMNLSSEKRAKT